MGVVLPLCHLVQPYSAEPTSAHAHTCCAVEHTRAAERSLRLHMCSAPHFMRAKMRTGPRERSLLMHTRRSPMLQSLRAQSHVAAEMWLCSGLTQRQKNSRLLASLDATTPMALLRTQRLMQSGRPTYAQRLRSPCARRAPAALVQLAIRPPLPLLHI